MAKLDLLYIHKYKLNGKEIAAFKAVLLYHKIHKKLFPQINITVSSKDPRKTEIFRYCWKMLDEIGDIDPELFIHAQLYIMKINNAFASYRILVGEKAKNRWLVWSAAYNKPTIKSEQFSINTEEVKKQLDKTYQFLASKNLLSHESILKALESRKLHLYYVLGQVSYYYIWLAPSVQKWVSERKLSDEFGIGINLYKDIVNNEKIKKYFAEKFLFEFT